MPTYFVVLVEPAFEESIGFIARAMANFALNDLRLVNPIASIGKTAHARAGHAQDILDNLRLYPSLVEALKDSDLSVGTTAQRARSLYRVLRRPSSPRELGSVVRSAKGSVALVFGREGTGLTNRELDTCDMVLTVPASEEYPTMNISHAAAIVFYELFSSLTSGNRELLADEKVKNALLEFLQRAALTTGVSARERGLAARALRNVMGRSAIRAREASSLAGVLRTIAGAVDKPSHAT